MPAREAYPDVSSRAVTFHAALSCALPWRRRSSEGLIPTLLTRHPRADTLQQHVS